MIATLAVLIASSSFADVRGGNANPNSYARYNFTTPFHGEVNITILWTNRNADLHVAVVCANGFLAGQSFGFLDRVIHLTVGLPGGFACTVLVNTFRGTSAFRLHVQHAAAQSFSNPVSIPTLTLSDGPADAYHEVIGRKNLERVRASLEIP